MNKTNYKQYDTRWASLPYPRRPYTIKSCGCGEVAICNVITGTEKYKNATPKTIRDYCAQFAAPNGNGTYFSGIPKMLAHYGLTEVKEHATMDKLWKELEKGGRVAIYLMGNRKGGTKQVHWTSSAHFVCSVGYHYDKKTKLHQLYVKDSNSMKGQRNGWISYEENMRGDVSRVWSAKLPVEKTEPKKTIDEVAKEVIDGKWGNGEERVEKLKAAGYDPDAVQKKVNEILAPQPTPQDKMCSWAKKMAASAYHYVKWTKDAKTHECPICHKHAKGKYYGGNCIWFAWASWHHGAGLKNKCGCGVFSDESYEKMLKVSASEALKIARQHIGLNDIKVLRSSKVIDMSKLQKGDVVMYFDGSNYKHTALYIGGGKIADCGNRKDAIQYGVKSYGNWKIKLAIRYIGK